MRGRLETRYVIAHPTEGVIDKTPTKSRAILLAERWAARNPELHEALYEIGIYDSMARRGFTELWKIVDKLWTPIRVRQ